jgi:signal transduction histidine kinase
MASIATRSSRAEHWSRQRGRPLPSALTSSRADRPAISATAPVATPHTKLHAAQDSQLAQPPAPAATLAGRELVADAAPQMAVEIAHDMRSPLSSILFLAEVLHRGDSGALNEVQRRQLGIIYSAALNLTNMTNDLVEMARETRLDGEPQPFSVNEVLAATESMVRPIAERRGLRLDVQQLHAANRIGHSGPLGRVLLNLATNALKYTDTGRVMLSARQLAGDVVEFAVRDTGKGLSVSELQSLFMPFRPDPTGARSVMFSATGLGLAMCRRLVESMGSKLQVRTGSRWGTRFSFRVHLPPADLISAVPAQCRPAATVVAPVLRQALRSGSRDGALTTR